MTKQVDLGLIGFTRKGDWASGYTETVGSDTYTGYAANDLVRTSDGSVWVSNVDDNVTEPKAGNTDWSPWVAVDDVAEAALKLIDTDHTVTVQVTTSVSGVSVSGLSLNVFENHSTTATTYTTDSSGKCSFTIPHGAYCEIHFPDIEGCNSISPKGFTVVKTQTVEAEYVEYSGKVEAVTVYATKYLADKSTEAAAGRTVTVKVTGGSTTTYTTDAEGKATFEIAVGKFFSVTIDKIDGMYVYGGYTHELEALSPTRIIRYDYYTYQSGVFVVGKDGNDYTQEEWEASGLTSDDARLIKIVTEDLMEKGYPIMYDPLHTALSPYVWCNPYNTLFSTIPTNGNSSSALYYYDGKSASAAVIAEAAEKSGVTIPAFTYAAGLSVDDVGGRSLHGYVPSVGQFVIMTANIEEADALAKAVWGDAAAQLASFKSTTKWTSTQASQNHACYFQSSASNDRKGTSYAVLPFFAY